MYTCCLDTLTNFGFKENMILLVYGITLIIILAISFAVRAILNFIIVRVIKRTTKRTNNKWGEILLRRKTFHRITYIVFPVVIKLFFNTFPEPSDSWATIIEILSTIVAVVAISALINAADEIYRSYDISKVKPIRGILQVVKVILFIIGGIVLISQLMGRSPLVLLSGIGAMTAVSTLIFKDAILGFVAGIQLSSNNMLHIGDWIEIPGHSANGTVVELSLTMVKVENFDQTITTVPAYSLVSEPFINWRSMQASGGRQIKRAIYIDATKIKPCDKAMIERLSKISLLKDHMASKLSDISIYNQQHGFDWSESVNGRRLTNIGVFRAYILAYIKQHPGIKKDMVMMVRQLSSDGAGIPLEVYAFANTVIWAEYEMIQSDIFDHLYSVINEFDLSAFQQPGGSDIREGLTTIKIDS
ncbi:MAG TPA: mechanosensitive ion channel domain-containing protein [Clostridia bacterium]|nr:mechanosensitive ion channel domain-containing protein [Clostridia bacterium]